MCEVLQTRREATLLHLAVCFDSCGFRLDNFASIAVDLQAMWRIGKARAVAAAVTALLLTSASATRSGALTVLLESLL